MSTSDHLLGTGFWPLASGFLLRFQRSLAGGGTKHGELPWDGIDRLGTPPTDVGY